MKRITLSMKIALFVVLIVFLVSCATETKTPVGKIADLPSLFTTITLYVPADKAGIVAVSDVELVFVTDVAAVKAVVVAVSTYTLEPENPTPVIVILPVFTITPSPTRYEYIAVPPVGVDIVISPLLYSLLLLLHCKMALNPLPSSLNVILPVL